MAAASPLPSPKDRRMSMPPPPSPSPANDGKLQPTVRFVDMDTNMQNEAMNLAAQAIKYTNQENEVARYVKRAFDAQYPDSAPWHCVVGRRFGSYVTHHTSHFIYFYIQGLSVLLFRAQD